MARESKAAKSARVLELLARLKAEYPDAHCELDYRNAFELLSATILSAQCTDVRVNLVTPALFARYPDAHALAAAKQEDVEALIRSTGFFRNKTKSLIGMAQGLVAEFDGEVPRTMAELRPLPGVGFAQGPFRGPAEEAVRSGTTRATGEIGNVGIDYATRGADELPRIRARPLARIARGGIPQG